MAGRKLIAEREHKKIYEENGKLYKTFDRSFSKADILNEALNTCLLYTSDAADEQ